MTVRELVALLTDEDQDANVLLGAGGWEGGAEAVLREDGYVVISPVGARRGNGERGREEDARVR